MLGRFNQFLFVFALIIFLFFGGLFSMQAKDSITLTPVTVGLDWYINPNHAPLLYAIADHRFEKAGLSVELMTPTDTTLPIKLVAAKKLDVCMSFEPQYHYAKKEGLPIIWLLTLVDQPLEAIAVKEDGPIQDITDLKGKRIGYAGGGSTKARLEQVLQHYQLSVRDVELINVKMNETVSLLSGRVDAIAGLMRNVEPIELKRQGMTLRLFKFEEHGVKPYAELIMVVHQDHAAEKWIEPFKRVISESIQALQQDPEGSWKIVKEYFAEALASTDSIAETNREIWMVTVPLFLNSSGASRGKILGLGMKGSML